jgi:hypothetical protein
MKGRANQESMKQCPAIETPDDFNLAGGLCKISLGILLKLADPH